MTSTIKIATILSVGWLVVLRLNVPVNNILSVVSSIFYRICTTRRGARALWVAGVAYTGLVFLWEVIQFRLNNFKILKAEIVSFNWKVYRKNPKNWDTQKSCCNHPKIWTTWLFWRVMHPKDTAGIANSVDPDQTAPRSSLIWVCTVCPDLSVWKLRIITVVLLGDKLTWFKQFSRRSAFIKLKIMFSFCLIVIENATVNNDTKSWYICLSYGLQNANISS